MISIVKDFCNTGCVDKTLMLFGSHCHVTPEVVKRKTFLLQCNKCLAYMCTFTFYFSLPFVLVYPFATLLIVLVLAAFIYCMWKRQNRNNEDTLTITMQGMLYVIIQNVK